LQRIAKSAARWAPGEEPSTENADPWQHARPLGEYLRGGEGEIEFYEARLLAPGCITEIFGPRGSGKSEFARHLAVGLARRGLRVLYVDRDNPPRVTRRSFAAWLRPGEDLGDRLHVLDRNHAPHLLAREAWRKLPPGRYDVVIVDSLDSAAEGVGEQDSARPSRALASLLDLARQENGPAVLVLGNVVKSGTHGRGSGVIEDRADIVIEARDATGLRPTGKKPWFQELPEASRAGWADRAARRAGREFLWLALVPTKFRVGEEPEPWAVELDFRTCPYTCREVTAELEAAARQALDEARRAQQEAEDRAAHLLAEEVRRRAAEGRPMFKRTEAEPLLQDLGLSRARARALIAERAGALWRLETTAHRGAKATVLLPVDSNKGPATVEGVLEPAQEAASGDTDRGRPHVEPWPWSLGAQIQSGSQLQTPPTVAALQEADGHGRVSGNQIGSALRPPLTVAAARFDSESPGGGPPGDPPGPGALDQATQEPEEEALPEWAVRLAEELPRRPETDPGAVAQAAAALLGPPLGPEDLSPATDQDPPVEPCWCCRGRRWWLRPRHLGGGWVCGRCHPPGPVEPVRWHETGPDGPNGPVSQPEADPPDWWMDAADLDDLERFMDDSDPGDPEAEPPDWPDLVQEGVAEMEPRAGRRPARWRLTEAVSFRARTNPSPETKRNESPDPPPGGTPEDHPPDPGPQPGGPPGPKALDRAYEAYAAHVEGCEKCSWTRGPRCEEGHRLRRAYHEVWQQALRSGTLTLLPPDLAQPPAQREADGPALPPQPEEDPPDW
jgi:hypothetical protein